MENIGYLLIGTSLISIITHKKNYLFVLISLEILFIGISLLFINTSFNIDDFTGIMVSLYILTIAARRISNCFIYINPL